MVGRFVFLSQALDPKEADVITGMIADRDSLLLRALNLLWPDEDMDDQRIEEAQMAMLQRFLVQAARHQVGVPFLPYPVP